MKKKYPRTKFKIPSKKLFRNLSSEFVQKRQAGLDEFVQQLVQDNEILSK